MIKNRLLTVIFCVFTILFTITFSIALPICIRPFYYAHIDAYNLAEKTGKSKEQIIEAYDEVLDYLTLPNHKFGTGDFGYSEEGKSHFEDCKFLFNLNFSVLFISLITIITLYILKRRKIFVPIQPFGKSINFISGLSTLLLFALIGGLCAINFDKAFVVFHKIFFYGKDNWVFDSSTDQIITALPQEFFLNCAVLIICSIVAISIFLILFGLFYKKKNK